MSKELTSLEWLNYYKNKLQSSSQTFRPNGFDIIETALKNYNQLQVDYDELNDIHNKLVKHKNKERDDVVKKLKALEIIKEKGVNVYNLTCICFKYNETYEQYVIDFNYGDSFYHLGKELLTQEEFDLLKEVLL